MSVPNDRQMKRRPTHPGEMLHQDFMADYGLTVADLADAAACRMTFYSDHRSDSAHGRWRTLADDGTP